jgi:hypothetical protein
MTITFKNDNNVIVYALNKVISYARRNQQTFMARCVWWLASVIGLEQGLVIYINSLRERSDDSMMEAQRPATSWDERIQDKKVASCMPEDGRKDSRPGFRGNLIHSDRINHVFPDISDLEFDTSEQNLRPGIIQTTEQFLQKSKKERKAFNKQKQVDQSSRIKSGKIVKPLSKGQQKYIQSIPNDTIEGYLNNRK